LFRHTIYYPYSWALQYARGAALSVLVESPTYDVQGLDQVPYLDVAGAVDREGGKVALFVLNRDLAKPHQVELTWEDKSPSSVASSWVITGDDLKASNGFENPKRVAPQAFAKPSTSGSRTTFEVPARSYTVIQWGL